MTDDAQHCPRCGAANRCAIAQGAQQCWCMVAPMAAIASDPNAASCYCRDCLRELSAAATEQAVQLHKPIIPR